MFYNNLTGTTALYRVTSPNTNWPSPLLGQGAHYSQGGRFNRINQATVYCSEDPLVVIAETAFYSALTWLRTISYQRLVPMTYPLISTHILWSFRIDPPPPVIDLEHPGARAAFQYPPYFLLNPSLNPRHGIQQIDQPASVNARDYQGTQSLADEIRGYIPPRKTSLPRPEGVKAPSIRLRKKYKHQPQLLALFFLDPSVQVPYQNRATLLQRWVLDIEFMQFSPRQPIDHNTPEIDWPNPRFRVGPAGTHNVPAYAGRPRAADIAVVRWNDLEIRYA